MKNVGRDLIILLLICAGVWALTRVRLHARQIEKMRAHVVFSTDFDQKTAERLLSSLEQVGFLNGVTRIYHIDLHDDVIQLQVVTESNILDDPKVEGLLQGAFSEVCRLSFPDRRVAVSLSDTHLKPFHELIAPRQF